MLFPLNKNGTEFLKYLMGQGVSMEDLTFGGKHGITSQL